MITVSTLVVDNIFQALREKIVMRKRCLYCGEKFTPADAIVELERGTVHKSCKKNNVGERFVSRRTHRTRLDTATNGSQSNSERSSHGGDCPK